MCKTRQTKIWILSIYYDHTISNNKKIYKLNFIKVKKYDKSKHIIYTKMQKQLKIPGAFSVVLNSSHKDKKLHALHMFLWLAFGDCNNSKPDRGSEIFAPCGLVSCSPSREWQLPTPASEPTNSELLKLGLISWPSTDHRQRPGNISRKYAQLRSAKMQTPKVS